MQKRKAPRDGALFLLRNGKNHDILTKKEGGLDMKKLIAVFLAAALLSGCAPIKEPEPKPTLPSSPYTPQDYQMQDGFLTCTAGQTILGIDVSSHQGQIDWQQVAASGIKFAMIRLGNRGYISGQLSADVYAKANLQGAKQAGVLVGAYFYSQAISVEEAREEAQFALEILGEEKLDLPLVYDWEYVNETARTADVDKRTLTDCTLAFCQKAEQAGYRAMVYFNSTQATSHLYMQELTAYPWWLAMYDITQEFPCKVDMWQYTHTGAVAGIAGNVDVNLLFADWGLGAELF